MSESEKKYVGNAKVIKTQYGDLMKISMTEADVETLTKSLKNGWVNINVKQRREPSPKGLTHYLEVDNWQAEGAKKEDKAVEIDDVDESDLPF